MSYFPVSSSSCEWIWFWKHRYIQWGRIFSPQNWLVGVYTAKPRQGLCWPENKQIPQGPAKQGFSPQMLPSRFFSHGGAPAGQQPLSKEDQEAIRKILSGDQELDDSDLDPENFIVPAPVNIKPYEMCSGKEGRDYLVCGPQAAANRYRPRRPAGDWSLGAANLHVCLFFYTTLPSSYSFSLSVCSFFFLFWQLGKVFGRYKRQLLTCPHSAPLHGCGLWKLFLLGGWLPAARGAQCGDYMKPEVADRVLHPRMHAYTCAPVVGSNTVRKRLVLQSLAISAFGFSTR